MFRLSWEKQLHSAKWAHSDFYLLFFCLRCTIQCIGARVSEKSVSFSVIYFTYHHSLSSFSHQPCICVYDLCFVWYEKRNNFKQRIHAIEPSDIATEREQFLWTSINVDIFEYRSHDRHTTRYIFRVCGTLTRARNKYNSFYVSDIMHHTDKQTNTIRSVSKLRRNNNRLIEWYR